MHRLRLALAALVALPAASLHGQAPAPDSAYFASMRWRSLGPANMGGRITDIEGISSPSKTFYVATVAGGIWKTTNAGTTFRPLFQHQRVVAMGDIAIAPSDTMQIWAGTGEDDSRNSVKPGGGIYKSTDGGLTWTLMGLEKTQHIGRILVHPTNPDIVYVAALGHLWGSNPERGVYRTTDGGKSWKKIKFISDKAGFNDLAMDPRNPNVIWAAAWQRVRGPYFLNSGGPGSGLWKSTDGGDTWTEVKGGGFPTGMKGRIGIAIAPSQPAVMYALVEAAGATKDAPNESGLYRSEDAGKTWTKMNDKDNRPFYYSQVRVDPADANRVYWSSTPVNFSTDGGKTVRDATIGIHVDQHAMWIDPKDGAHILVGDDGGVAQSWDRGGNFQYLNVMPIAQFYAVSYDMSVPYRVCGGLQDNGSWCGPSRRARGAIDNHMWATVAGGDGFYTQQDPRDGNVVYAESQGGSMVRVNFATGESDRLQKPDWQDTYRMWGDSMVLARGDTTTPVSAALKKRIAGFRARQLADSADQDLRWNWNTPFLLSPHNPDVFYAGANKVLRSTMRGDSLKVISPDLSTGDTMRIRVSTQTTGGITKDVTGAETHATVTALAESPLKQGTLFAGTDDGNVWISPDDGGHWTNLTPRFAKLVPPKTWVSRIEPSAADVNRFYVAFDGHQDDDFTPYLFVTDDGGKSFRSIAGGLPSGGPDYVQVIREDPVDPNLLFVGTDVGAYVSLDRGKSWRLFMENLPTVPVHDLKIQPRDHELIAGTHGRSLWIVDILPLEQLHSMNLATPQFLDPKPGLQFSDSYIGGESTGQQVFLARSPEYGAQLSYWLPESLESKATAATAGADGNGNDSTGPAAPGGAAGERGSAGREGAAGRGGPGARGGRGPRGPQVHVAILDEKGDTVQTLNGPGTKGLHTIVWNYRKKPEPRKPLSPSERQDSVVAMAKLQQIADSMIAAGSDRQAVERTLAMMKSGDLSGIFRGFGGGEDANYAGEAFHERPAESPPPRERGGEAAGGAAAGGAAASANVGREMFQAMRDSGIRLPGGGRGFGRFGGESAKAGDYTVVIDLGNGQTLKRMLHVIGSDSSADDGPSMEEMEEWLR